MDKYIKRIQSRLTYSGVTATKGECREAYQKVIPGAEWGKPTDDQLNLVVQHIKETQHSQPELEQTQQLAIIKPEIIEISVQDMPCLNPPEQIQPDSKSSGSLELPPQSDTNPGDLAVAEGQSSGSGITQSQIADMVSSAFGSQSAETKDQVTEYALQQSFASIRQVQDFLEQLRGMEFTLLAQTLQDHCSRRGSMLAQLNNLFDAQGKVDQQKREDFFDQFNNRIHQFQREMESKLAKQKL